MKEIVFLILLVHGSTGDVEKIYTHEFATMQQCQNAVNNSKIVIPSGGDAESSYVMYCAQDKPKRHKK